MPEQQNNQGYKFTVNETTYETDDPMLSAREILTRAGCQPASEFQLVRVQDARTHLLSSDDKVTLRPERIEVFRAFPGDRAYSFTLNEVGQVWGASSISVKELFQLFQIPPGKELVLERKFEPDTILQEEGTVSFEPNGVEHIIARPAQDHGHVLVTVFATAGVFPTEGALRVAASTLVQEVLDRAAKKLKLGDTSGWVVSVNGRDIVPASSFEQNGLTGKVELEWSAREGGGGYA